MERTWLGRSGRRFARVGIGLAAFLVGLAAFAIVATINVLLTDDFHWWYWEVWSVVGVLTAVTVFALFDRLGLVPDDPDPLTTLSLNGPSEDNSVTRSQGGPEGPHYFTRRAPMKRSDQ